MNLSGALLTADLSVSVVLTSQLIPSPHTKSLLQQEDPQLEVEVLSLEAVDPLSVVPHGPVEAKAGVVAGVVRPAQRVRVVRRGEDLGALPCLIIYE